MSEGDVALGSVFMLANLPHRFGHDQFDSAVKTLIDDPEWSL